MKSQCQLGRPKDIAKRDAILQAARDIFSHGGFNAMTMDNVAVRAGVSKTTVYSHFVDKETLFEHFAMSVSDRMTDALAAPAPEGRTLRDRLVATGLAFLDTVCGPDALRMLLTMPIVAQSNSHLAKSFYEAGPGRTRTALVAMIDDYVERGELTVDRAEWAADDLLGLWDGGLPAKILFAIDTHLTRAEITRRATRAVDIFLKAYAVAPDVVRRATVPAR